MTADLDIITIADTCVDIILDLGDKLPQFGQVEQWVSDYFVEMGGSACIFACQAARLGLRVGVLGRVGDDAFGRLVVERMRQSGVDTRFLTVDPHIKTGAGVALCRADGDRAILTYGGSLNAVYPADVSDSVLVSARHLHYCSYYLQTNLLPVAPVILQRARSLGLTVSLDTNWDPSGQWQGGIRQALRQADIFFPNENEATALTGKADVSAALRDLLQSVSIVVLKMGEQGCLVGQGSERLRVSVQPVARPVDTIGAGDSFDAGFVAGWLEGLPLQACAAIGNACGRAVTQGRGGVQGQPWRRDITELR